MKEISDTNVYTGLCSLGPLEDTNRMFVVSGGATKISSGNFKLDQGDIIVLGETCAGFSMEGVTIKGMLLKSPAVCFRDLFRLMW